MATTKYIHELPAGTTFKWMDRHFVIADNKIIDNEDKPTDSITNGFVVVREINGVGTKHSWLSVENKFHADVQIECPELMDWLKQ